MSDGIRNITLKEMRELVAKETWVKTPYRYTQLGAGLSLIQQQALLMVSDLLQSYIRDFYNLHLDKSRVRPKPLFSEYVLERGLPPFRIYLQDLGVLPSNYKEARRAIDEINLKVEHPEIGENGLPTGKTLLTNVFSQFGFEETGEYYHFDSGEGERKAVAMKQPYIDVKINPDVADWAFDMSQGYVNHLKMIASYSSKRPTPRLYLMLMNRTKKGEKVVTIPLAELKEYLGIAPNTYPKFANFRQKVLDAVKQDLDRMAEADHTDITFCYELQYPGTRKTGDPDAVIFHIERTVLGDAYNVVVNHKPSEIAARLAKQQDMFAEEWRNVWHKCKADMLSQCTKSESRAKVESIEFLSFNADTKGLLLQVPNEETFEFFETGVILEKLLRPTLTKYFGKGIELKYKVL
jgi:hypothetical protein